jgi:hypothetical protein
LSLENIKKSKQARIHQKKFIFSYKLIAQMILLKWFCSNDFAQMILLKWFCSNDFAQMILRKWFCSNDFAQMMLHKWCCSNDVAQMMLLKWCCPNDVAQMMILLKIFCSKPYIRVGDIKLDIKFVPIELLGKTHFIKNHFVNKP